MSKEGKHPPSGGSNVVMPPTGCKLKAIITAGPDGLVGQHIELDLPDMQAQTPKPEPRPLEWMDGSVLYCVYRLVAAQDGHAKPYWIRRCGETMAYVAGYPTQAAAAKALNALGAMTMWTPVIPEGMAVEFVESDGTRWRMTGTDMDMFRRLCLSLDTICIGLVPKD